MGVLIGAEPRREVLEGDLDDAIFAADFGDLISGDAPNVYKKPSAFFQNTHPAAALRTVTESVFKRLADKTEAGATIRLSTGFGGGKTHTLMALWHLAKNIGDPAMGTELLPAAGRPKSVTLVAIDASKAGVPVFSTHRNRKIKSLWGGVFFQLGGERALKSLGDADDPEASPSEQQIRSVFPAGPVLILLDELVIYMARLSDRGQGNLLGFLNSLASVVSKRPQTVLVVTDPSNQAAYAAESASLGARLQHAALKLTELQSRKVSDFDPIGNEAHRIITRRLFKKIDAAAAQAASASYHSLYERLASEDGNPIFKNASTSAYAQQLVECYPFHPRLLATAQGRLGAMKDFQQSRGVLRLFARIIRDLWERNEDLELVTAGEIDWTSKRIRADLLDRLQRDRFRAAISADIENHASELDGGEERGIHGRAASALLLESLPLDANSGLDKADLTLAILRPDEAGPEPGEALDRLAGVCWHTYPMEGDRGMQFRYEPNIIKQIEERMREVSPEDAKMRVLADAQTYFSGPRFRLAAWPATSSAVSESAELSLVLCEDPSVAESVCKYSDNSNPEAPMPRKFRNSILAVAPTTTSFKESVARAQRLIAAEQIERDSGRGEARKMVREQLTRIKPELAKRFQIQTRRCFDQLFTAAGPIGKLDEQYQVEEEKILGQAQGQACILNYLTDKNLVYKPDTQLDVPLFLSKILSGATPLSGQTDTCSAKAVHERFLAAPELRLVPNSQIVTATVRKALSDGKILIRLADGRVFDKDGCVQGPDGSRRRTSASLTGFALADDIFITAAGSATADQWTKIDEEKPGGGSSEEDEESPPVPKPPDSPFAATWERAIELAEEKPLLELTLTVRSPGAAAGVPTLIQPLGAKSISLTLSTGGALRDSGTMQFAANGVKLTHPAKPLNTARTIFNSLAEGASYEAQFKLFFGDDGRADMSKALAQLRDNCPEEVRINASFESNTGAEE